MGKDTMEDGGPTNDEKGGMSHLVYLTLEVEIREILHSIWQKISDIVKKVTRTVLKLAKLVVEGESMDTLHSMFRANQSAEFSVGDSVRFQFLGDGHHEPGIIRELYVDELTQLKGAVVQLTTGKIVRGLYMQLSKRSTPLPEMEYDGAQPAEAEPTDQSGFEPGEEVRVQGSTWVGYHPIFERSFVDEKTGVWIEVSLKNKKGEKKLYKVRPDKVEKVDSM